MNLALEKGERVTMGGKGRGEIGSKAGEVTLSCVHIHSLFSD